MTTYLWCYNGTRDIFMRQIERNDTIYKEYNKIILNY